MVEIIKAFLLGAFGGVLGGIVVQVIFVIARRP